MSTLVPKEPEDYNSLPDGRSFHLDSPKKAPQKSTAQQSISAQQSNQKIRIHFLVISLCTWEPDPSVYNAYIDIYFFFQ